MIAIALSLLCIVLPLRSVADAVANGKHCPMMQARVHTGHVHTDQQLQVQAGPHGEQASTHHADSHPTSHSPVSAASSHDCCNGNDCCNDEDTVAHTGQLCKMGQKCSTPMAYLLPPATLQVGVATQHTVVTTLPIPLHFRPPAAVWRPPSLT